MIPLLAKTSHLAYNSYILAGNELRLMPRTLNATDETSRLLAIIQGKMTYKPSSPCNRGHQMRFVSNGHCVPCEEQGKELFRARTTRSEMREYRRSNGEDWQPRPGWR